MSKKAIKLNFSQCVMQTFWNKIMQLPNSILSEVFSTDVITLWHGYTVPLRAADTRRPGLSWQMRPVVLCHGQLHAARLTVESSLAPALEGCRSSVELCFPACCLALKLLSWIKRPSPKR